MEDTPTKRVELPELAVDTRKKLLEELRHRRTIIAFRVQKVRDNTKSRLGVINKRLDRIDKMLEKIEDSLSKAELALEKLWD